VDTLTVQTIETLITPIVWQLYLDALEEPLILKNWVVSLVIKALGGVNTLKKKFTKNFLELKALITHEISKEPHINPEFFENYLQ